MKVYSTIPVISLFFLLTVSDLTAQENDWEWARFIDGPMSYPSFVQSVDIFNNYYPVFGYGDTIAFPDTLFHHPWSEIAWYYALAKYDYHGQYQLALDFASLSNSGIGRITSIDATNGHSVYVAGHWFKEMLISDTIVSNPSYSNGFVSGFTSQGERIWTKFITGTNHITMGKMIHSPGNRLTVAGEQYAAWDEEKIVFFGTDSLTHLYQLLFVFQFDSLGNRQWITPIKALNQGLITLRDFRSDESGRFWLEGETQVSLIIGGDTILHPNSGQLSFSFLIGLDAGGSCFYGKIFPMNWNIHDFIPGKEGCFFFSGSYYDSLVFNNLTILAPPPTYYPCILGKMDSSLNILWYHTFEPTPYYGYTWLNLSVFNDTLFPVLTFQHSVTIGDSTYAAGYYPKSLIMEYGSGGDLLDLFMLQGSKLVRSDYVMCDHCSNLAIAGYFSGTAVFGDTSFVTSGDTAGFIARYIRVAHPFDLGNDTTAIDEYWIDPPGQWAHYNWNHGESAEPCYRVTKTGWYTLSVADSNWCWRTDSIHVTIKPNPGIGEPATPTLFLIHPNPTTGTFILEDAQALPNQPLQLEVYSIHGEQVLSIQCHRKQTQPFSLAGQPAGVYVIRIISGNLNQTARIILL